MLDFQPLQRAFRLSLALSWAVGIAVVGLHAQGFVDSTPLSGLAGFAPAALPLGSGMCSADFDGDGDQDLLLPDNPGGPLRLMENLGGFQFADRSASDGLGTAGLVRGCFAADLDNDGDQDVVIRRRYEPTQLFINDGFAHFTEEAAARGVVDSLTVDGFGACFGDYDRDGWLDLYLCNRDALEVSCCPPNQLFRNLGDGTFEDVSFQAGVANDGLTLCASFIDYNQDGWPDLLCTNDKGLDFRPNALFKNNGDGTFTDVSLQTNAGQFVDGMGLDFLDVFNDGGIDFFVTDIPTDHLFQVWDPLLSAYTVQQQDYGLGGDTVSSGWAAHFLDFNNDRWQDLHVVHDRNPNYLCQNPGAPASSLTPWPEVAQSVGLDEPSVQLVALIADFDNDGRVDVLNRLSLTGFPPAPTGYRLMSNDVSGGNWIKVQTVGTTSNRDGIGTLIRASSSGVIQQQAVRNGTGYLAGSDPRVHFGLGDSSSVRLELNWPSGHVQVLRNVAANQILEVVEPSFTFAGTPAIGTTGALVLNAPLDGGLGYVMALSFNAAPGIPLADGRVLPLSPDALLRFTLASGNAILPAPIGVVPASGYVSAALHIPAIPALAGLTVYSTAATFNSLALIETVFPTALALTLQ